MVAILALKITCTSDLHGHYPSLPGGDLLIVAGDVTARDEPKQYLEFFSWMAKTPYKKRILVAGNHDMMILRMGRDMNIIADFEYLLDSGTEFEGIKIWGTPWSLWFPQINPHTVAFTGDEGDLKRQHAKIPQGIDILVSHGPPKHVLDATIRGEDVGSFSLRDAIDRTQPRVLICGHIHEAYGKTFYKHAGPNTMCYNVSHVNEHYQPVNPPSYHRTMKTKLQKLKDSGLIGCLNNRDIKSSEYKQFLDCEYPYACIKWVHLKEAKPPHNKRVMLCDFTGWIYFGFYDHEEGKYCHTNGDESGVGITHWAEIPESPDHI